MITISEPTDFDKSRYQPEVQLKIDKYNRLAARKHGNISVRMPFSNLKSWNCISDFSQYQFEVQVDIYSRLAHGNKDS